MPARKCGCLSRPLQGTSRTTCVKSMDHRPEAGRGEYVRSPDVVSCPLPKISMALLPVIIMVVRRRSRWVRFQWPLHQEGKGGRACLWSYFQPRKGFKIYYEIQSSLAAAIPQPVYCERGVRSGSRDLPIIVRPVYFGKIRYPPTASTSAPIGPRGQQSPALSGMELPGRRKYDQARHRQGCDLRGFSWMLLVAVRQQIATDYTRKKKGLPV